MTKGDGVNNRKGRPCHGDGRVYRGLYLVSLVIPAVVVVVRVFLNPFFAESRNP